MHVLFIFNQNIDVTREIIHDEALKVGMVWLRQSADAISCLRMALCCTARSVVNLFVEHLILDLDKDVYTSCINKKLKCARFFEAARF